MNPFVITVHTKDEECFGHIASTLELGIKWIKKHGGNWYHEPYAFIVHQTEIDKDDYVDNTDTKYFDEHGVELTCMEFNEKLEQDYSNQ